MAVGRNPEGFYVFHDKEWPDGPTRLTAAAVAALGGRIPAGAALTPEAFQTWKEMQAAPAAPAAEAPADPGYDYSGGGYSDGGGGGGYTPPPAKPLASSPEWLAYLNSLGLEEGQFRADIARQQGVLRTTADQQIGDLGPAGRQQRGGIAINAASRGVSRSGETLTRLANQRAGEGRAQAGIQTALAGQMSGLESQLANKLIDLGARRAQEELSLRAQGYV